MSNESDSQDNTGASSSEPSGQNLRSTSFSPSSGESQPSDSGAILAVTPSSLSYAHVMCQCPSNCPTNGMWVLITGSGGVRASDGQVVISSQVDFKSAPYNFGLSTVLQYNNLSESGAGFGSRWGTTILNKLTYLSGYMLYTISPTIQLAFQADDSYGGGFAPNQQYWLSRTAESPAGYQLTCPDGETRHFLAPDHFSEATLDSIKNRSGNHYAMSYDSAGLLQTATMQVGTLKFIYAYTWGEYSVITSIILRRSFLNGSVWSAPEDVEKIDYNYNDSFGSTGTPRVISRSINVNAANVYPPSPPSSPATTSWQFVEAEMFNYEEVYGKLRHVVPPTQYKQMVNNGIANPNLATEEQLNAFAETEYEFDGDRVSVMRTHGRTYIYEFTYSNLSLSDTTNVNSWTDKTTIKYPDGTYRIIYLNWNSQVLLDMRQTAAGNRFTTAQRFDSNAWIQYSADTDAIDASSFSETKPALVDLFKNKGRIEKFTWDTNGNLSTRELMHGTLATSQWIELCTYVTRGTSAGAIYLLSTREEYRSYDHTNSILTSYTYDGASTSLSYSKRTTHLPNVLAAENGRNLTVTREENYDGDGYLTSTIDELGTETRYGYDKVKGGLISMIQDFGTDPGKLNLTTDYQLDREGRVTRELGPTHPIDVGGVETPVRTARWTLYNDPAGETRSFPGYLVVSSGAVQVIGPVTVTQPNLAPPALGEFATSDPVVSYTNWRRSSVYEAAFTGSTLPTLTTVFPRSSWVRWNIELFDQQSEKSEEWSYFLIPPESPLKFGTQSTHFGRKFFAYDSRGRQNQTTCAGGTIDKTTYNELGWAMQEEIGTSHGLNVTRINEYDSRGNLKTVTLPVDTTSSHDRVTISTYDWRNRLEQLQTTVEKTFGGAEWTLFEKYVYDNRDQLTETRGYHTSVTTGPLTRYETQAWDVLGRLYRKQAYGVTSAGSLANAQISNWYYAKNGQVVRQAPASSALFTAATYDALGRTTKVFQAYEPNGYASGSDPASMASAFVLEQQEATWDNAGNLTVVISRARFDNASIAADGKGELKNKDAQPTARVSYVAAYPDGLNRQAAVADYGTNASAAWSRSTTIPTSTDTRLVTTYAYSNAGNQSSQTDPIGQVTSWTYDPADRLTILVENSAGTGTAVRTTRCDYTDDGWLLRLKSDNADTGQQVTQWVYGVKSDEGSQLNSNRLPLFKYYPDTSSTTDRVYYGYNRQQQVVAQQDQAGTNHVFGYDKFGRLVTDTATAVGSNIDNTVRQIMTGYNERGLLERKLSYSQTFSVVNDVYMLYNEYNQLVTEYQAHYGATDLGSTPKVQYGYAAGATGQRPRLTGITYPNGNVVTLAYGGPISNGINRPDALVESGVTLASYRFMGLGTQVGLKYDAASATELTYQVGSTGDAGDQYTGIDRFGRLVKTLWQTGTTAKVQSSYGRNRAGGVVWRKDLVAPSTANQDTYYNYDGIQQVSQYQRGLLTGPTDAYTGITAAASETFVYDQTGNWNSFTRTPGPLLQTRSQNKANEITGIADTVGIPVPTYDAVGNMTLTSVPSRPSTTAFPCQWDAWNRLVKVGSTSSPVANYEYDGMSRRTESVLPTISASQSFYYDRTWRMIEEHKGGAVQTYLWSPFDRWTLLRRLKAVAGSPDEKRWCLKDGLDPVAVIDSTGAVLGRLGYDAFGNTSYLSDTFGTTTFSPADWNFAFHGEFMDGETGLYNYGYRYYHPNLGRWLSRDPLGESAGTNLYAFLYNCPTSQNDLLGLINLGHAAANWMAQNPNRDKSVDGKVREQAARGCIGLTCIKTGTEGIPDLSGCFTSREGADKKKKEMDDTKACCSKKNLNGDPASAVIFSVHYGRGAETHGVTTSGDNVDFTNWYPTTPTIGNDFDFGFLNPDGSVTAADQGGKRGNAVDYKDVADWDANGKAEKRQTAWCVSCNSATFGKYGDENKK